MGGWGGGMGGWGGYMGGWGGWEPLGDTGGHVGSCPPLYCYGAAVVVGMGGMFGGSDMGGWGDMWGAEGDMGGWGVWGPPGGGTVGAQPLT